MEDLIGPPFSGTGDNVRVKRRGLFERVPDIFVPVVFNTACVEDGLVKGVVVVDTFLKRRGHVNLEFGIRIADFGSAELKRQVND